MGETDFRRRGAAAVALTGVVLGALLGAACGNIDAATPQSESLTDSALPSPSPSALDAELFYQLLIGEVELRGGDPGAAYQVFLDAANRTRNAELFRRAMDVALQARAGEEALAATRAWHAALPEDADPLRLQLQILMTMNRLGDTIEPARALLDMTPAADRADVISALPGLFARAKDKTEAATTLATLLEPYAASPATRTAARISTGRAWLAAGDSAKALSAATGAHADDHGAPGPVLLAIELIRSTPQAEVIVTNYLSRPKAALPVRLAYVQLLIVTQRHGEAIRQLQVATRAEPDNAAPLLTLGALHLEMRQFGRAEAVLRRYLTLADKSPQGADDARQTTAAGKDQAWLMLSQSAEQRGDYAAAERLLARVDDPQRAREVQARRASLLARQGRVDDAVALLRGLPEDDPGDARTKLVAEAQLLRDIHRWNAAYKVFAAANERFPDDVDLIYDQAMMADKIGRFDEMERLLRRVIELKPDHGHAYNALGYALADRGKRLPEARDLIQRALELRPGDPFVTDSLGWVEFRLGNREEALRLLRAAWQSRPDTEIGAHLGEVLWSLGMRDEARAIWRQAGARDKGNAVLRETLARLQVAM